MHLLQRYGIRAMWKTNYLAQKAPTIPELTPEPHGTETECIFLSTKYMIVYLTLVLFERNHYLWFVSLSGTKLNVEIKSCVLSRYLLGRGGQSRPWRKKRQSLWMLWILAMENISQVAVYLLTCVFKECSNVTNHTPLHGNTGISKWKNKHENQSDKQQTNKKSQHLSSKRSNPLFSRECQCICRRTCERDGVNCFMSPTHC